MSRSWAAAPFLRRRALHQAHNTQPHHQACPRRAAFPRACSARRGRCEPSGGGSVTHNSSTLSYSLPPNNPLKPAKRSPAPPALQSRPPPTTTSRPSPSPARPPTPSPSTTSATLPARTSAPPSAPRASRRPPSCAPSPHSPPRRPARPPARPQRLPPQGPAGGESELRVLRHVFFEKVQIREGKEKSEDRRVMEKKWWRGVDEEADYGKG